MASAPDGCLVSFYDPDGNVRIVNVSDTNDDVTTIAVIKCPIQPFDAHNCISMTRTSTNTLHVVFGAHASEAYFASLDLAANRGEAAQAIEPTSLPGREVAQFTYPMFLTDKDTRDPMLVFRSGHSKSGAICVKKWDGASHLYVDDAAPLISGAFPQSTAGPYLNTPIVSSDGMIGLFFVWRLPEKATSGGAVLNAGIDYVMSTDNLKTLRTIEGLTIHRPLTPASTPRVYPVPLGTNLINQASAALRFDGAPMALTYWSDAGQPPQYRLVWREKDTWTSTVVSDFQTLFKLDGKGTLPLPHSRPELLVANNGDVLCIFRSVEYQGRLMLRRLRFPAYRMEDSDLFVLLDDDLGQYEPVVHREVWTERGVIRMYVQACDQVLGDVDKNFRTETSFLCEWGPASAFLT